MPETDNDLFTAHARHTDPDTSHEAADSVKRIRQSQEFILTLLREGGHMTDEEIWARISAVIAPVPVSTSGARTRRSELVALGKVIDSGERRLTKANRKTIVWKAVDTST